MPFPLSPQSIDAIIISGGGNDPTPPIGIYRSGPKIEKFMRGCNVAFTVNGSRVSFLVQCLTNLNKGFEAEQVLPSLIEAAADPRDFIHEPERHVAVLDHLNRALRFDGFEVQQQGGRMRLAETGKGVPVLVELAGLSEVIDFDTVSRDLARALASSQTRPVGRPPDHMIRTHAGFSHQAGSWDKKRRVVARVERHPGERVPRVGFIVTRLSRPARHVVASCNRHGAAGQHIEEGRNAIVRTRLSCRGFRNIECRAGFMRSPAIPVTSCARRVCRRRRDASGCHAVRQEPRARWS